MLQTRLFFSSLLAVLVQGFNVVGKHQPKAPEIYGASESQALSIKKSGSKFVPPTSHRRTGLWAG